MEHVTHHTSQVGQVTFSHIVSSLALTVWERKGAGIFLQRTTDQLNEIMNQEGVYRTAFASPGLLNIPESHVVSMGRFYLIS